MKSNWSRTSLGKLITIKHGFALKGEYFQEEDNGWYVTTPGNFLIGGGFKTGKPKYYNGPIPEDYILKPGQLIVTMTDLSKKGDTLGYSAFVPDNLNYQLLHNQRIGLVELLPDSNANINFIGYLMRWSDYQEYIVSTSSGSTVKHTSPSKIYDFEFYLPTIQEQEKIVNILKIFDDKISNNQSISKTLEDIARSIFKSWFITFDPIKAKMEGKKLDNIDREITTIFPDKLIESELGLIPNGWNVGNIDDLVKINQLSWNAKHSPKTIEYLDLSNIKENKIGTLQRHVYSESPSRAKRRVLPGDTIIATVRPGNKGFGYIYKNRSSLTVSTGFAVLTPKRKNTSEFIYCATTSDEAIDRLNSLADGAAYPAVRPDTIKSQKLIIPDNSIFDKFSSLVKPIFKRLGVIEDETKELIKLRDIILPELMSGNLNISKQKTSLNKREQNA